MGVHIGAQGHANCTDQGFKCFAAHLAWGRQPIVFTEFKAGFGGWCFNRIYLTFCIFGLHTSSTCRRW